MKGIAPKHVTMADIYRSALPCIVCNLIVLAIMVAFPYLALGLPGLQGR